MPSSVHSFILIGLLSSVNNLACELSTPAWLPCTRLLQAVKVQVEVALLGSVVVLPVLLVQVVQLVAHSLTHPQRACIRLESALLPLPCTREHLVSMWHFLTVSMYV